MNVNNCVFKEASHKKRLFRSGKGKLHRTCEIFGVLACRPTARLGCFKSFLNQQKGQNQNEMHSHTALSKLWSEAHARGQGLSIHEGLALKLIIACGGTGLTNIYFVCIRSQQKVHS